VVNDSGLTDLLSGRIIPSDHNPAVTYKLVEPLGEGGMGVAFYAVREAPDGVVPAVVKVVRPEIVGTAGDTALLMIQKEAIALGRLNERVPPTPFVVKFLDTGIVELPTSRRFVLPWIALEYVHGGAEGTTLEHRVSYSVKHTRFAFDAVRAARVIECISEGLTAIHEVGVVHRDLTPGNVLCSGFGHDEVPKIADFGIARPTGVQATFGSVLLGTPGYASPEQSFSAQGSLGPWTDVFSFACLTYFLLTGEQYFDTDNFARALMMVRETNRRSLLEAPALSPELRDNPTLCRTIDAALAHATQMNPNERTPQARAFAASVIPTLRAIGGPRSQRASERHVASVAGRSQMRTISGWAWTMRHPPGDDRLVRSVAWDADGHALTVTTDGVQFWNGTSWVPARTTIDPAVGLSSVGLIRPGTWLLSGQNGLLAVLGTDGTVRTMHGPADADLSSVSGDPDDLAVAVALTEGRPPFLYTIAAGHFFKPLPLEAARTVAAIARLDETHWLVAGRTVQGTGFSAVYSALTFDVTFLLSPPTDAYTAAAAHVDRGFGVALGRRGAAVRFDGNHAESSVVDGAPDLASAAMDVQGRAWGGTTGRLFSQGPEPRTPWLAAWQNPAWRTPFVSIHADVGVVTAMTVDGAVVQGRTATPGRA
jgi:eukaryotic-like serine/threonine-protein kinase